MTTSTQPTLPAPDDLSDLRCLRIVAVPRGSWKWQNAYAVTRYGVRRTRDGRTVWYALERVTGKLSLPQLCRLGYGDLPHGSLHHRPCPIPTAGTPDWRPDATIPEDYYAC